MNQNDKNIEKKMSYSKPSIKIIELETEEVLAVGCKNSSGVAVSGSFPPCWSNSCQSNGS